jgi:hypothetical protein
VRRAHGWILAVVLVAAAGCGGPVASPGASPSTSGGSASAGSSSAAPLTIPITIAGGQVQPNGEKITAALGQQVVLQVTSDKDDEIHAHTGGDGYELEVPAGKLTTGTFTPTQPGSFEIESHHLEKVIVILNVR